MVCIDLPISISQIFIVKSELPVAKILFGVISIIDQTGKECPLSTLSHFPDYKSHTLNVLSLLPDAILLSAKPNTVRTKSSCPGIVITQSQFPPTFQTLTNLSSAPLINLPSEDILRDLTPPACPVIVFTSYPSA